MSDSEPRSLYVHCSNHCLDLVLQESSKSCDIIAEALSTVKDLSKVILESKKRKSVYSSMSIVLPSVGDPSDEPESMPNSLRPLCPTMWTVRVKSMKRFTENYTRVQETLSEILQGIGSMADNIKAVLKGYQTLLGKFESLLGRNISIALYCPCEELARVIYNARRQV